MTTQFNFGSLPTVSTTSSANTFSFGPTAGSQTLGAQPTMSTTGSAFSFGPNPVQSTGLSNPTLTLTLTTTPTAVTQTSTQQLNAFHGLGGTQTTASESGADTTLSANKSSRESTLIPPEMVPLVEALKQFVKEQKMIREENSQQRFSIQPILEVGSEIEDNLRVVLHKIEVDIQRNGKAIDGLKRDTNKLLSSAEMAYRISRIDLMQTPSSYTIAQNKYINASSHQYFIETIGSFESQMNNYSKQIQDLRTHIEYMNKPYNSEELLQIMRKQHETLICLAAKVYQIHEDINQLKLNLKKQTNYTSKLTQPNTAQPITYSPNRSQSLVGPNPFGLTGDDTTPTLHMTQPANTPTTTGLTNQLFSSIGTPLQPMPTTPSSLQFSVSSPTPSASHSRAKRWTTS